MIEITPEDLIRKHGLDPSSLEGLKKLASKPEKKCENCNNRAWRYGDTGLCFTCTTGESDDSNDYELVIK